MDKKPLAIGWSNQILRDEHHVPYKVWVVDIYDNINREKATIECIDEEHAKALHEAIMYNTSMKFTEL